MPHHKSCKKRLKTANKARGLNRAFVSQLRTRLKKFRSATSAAEASALLPELSGYLDRLAKKRIIKVNRASRLKSRLQLRANSLPQS
jgi:ribosomal protein S20